MKSERINSELAALLAKVYVIAKKNDDFQRRTGSAFNVFNICGIDHYETKHSAILAALLDPSGAHGLGPEFLLLRFLTSPLNLPAPGRRQPIYFALRLCIDLCFC